MSMKLYELSDTINDLWNLVDSDEVDLEVLEDTLQSVEIAFSDKAEGIASMMQSLALEAEALKQEEQRLSARRKARENKAAWLKSYLEREMLTSGLSKVKTAKFTLNIQNNNPSVEILDPTAILPQYLVYPEPTINKKAILEDLKNGVIVDGAKIRVGRSLRVK